MKTSATQKRMKERSEIKKRVLIERLDRQKEMLIKSINRIEDENTDRDIFSDYSKTIRL
jgi:hypothetical protein